MTPRRLHQLEAFRAVMHGGSVTRAAEMLNLSQPAVTKLLRALEEETRLALFDRSRRRLTPTQEARRFEAEAERFFAAATRMDRIANDMRSAGMGELRVATLPSFGFSFVPGLLARFARQVRQLRVSVTVASSLEVHEMVAGGLADLGFALPLSAAPASAVAEPIRLPGILVLPPGHRLARRRRVTLAELQGEPCISLGRQYRLRDLVDELFERHGVAPVPVAETQNAAAACAMAAEGLGFTVVEAITAAQFAGRVVLRPLEPTVEFPVNVLAPPGRPVAVLAARFLEMLRAEADAQSARAGRR